MRKTFAVLIALALLATPTVQRGEVHAAPSIRASPPGQVVIVSINARQHLLLGIKRFTMMFELSRALRRRPVAFNGGFQRSVAPADVIVIQEIRASNLEIFERLLQQRYNMPYQVVGLSSARAVFIVNTEVIDVLAEPTSWEDPCFNESNVEEERSIRTYQVGRFAEKATGSPFTVAGVHFSKDYTEQDCLVRNVQELKRQVRDEIPPVYVVGDFNRRSTLETRECDEEEVSEPLAWWSEMTTATEGPAFIDTVKDYHRSRGWSMRDEWTHEQKIPGLVCDQSTRIRRTRIDYIFSTHTVTAQAHADHPGWSGGDPGTLSPVNPKYSDHRFVWGRYVLSGPPQPAPPMTVPDAGGLIHVSWAPVEEASSYLVYRSVGGRPYEQMATITAPTTTFDDPNTEHGATYRYAIAPVSPTQAQGMESLATPATADARGPRVARVLPRKGATGVDIRSDVVVVYDDRVAPDSVTQDTLMLFTAKGRRIPGTVDQIGRRRLMLEPFRRLEKGYSYYVVARSVRDHLGNKDRKFSWGWRTVEPPPPPPKKKRRRR